jgi:dihydrofolate reductase
MVKVEITMSLDGFVAGPNATLEEPLGEGGELLHEWLTGLRSFREAHGGEGGEDSEESRSFGESFRAAGAHIMGRRMFSGGSGSWAEDSKADGWWGDDPPFHAPVFVLTHHEREPLVKEGGTTFTFVTDGIESALEQARAAAGSKDVAVAGGADVVQQYLHAGVVDELRVHVAPVLLGGGVPLFSDQERETIRLMLTDVRSGPVAAHLTYRPA